MAAGEVLAAGAKGAAVPPLPGSPASTLTLRLSLSREALGALESYLRSGAARGQPFEQALRDALSAGAPPATSHPAARTRCSLSPRTLRKVHEFIAANLAREIRIEDIAHAAFLSPYHLGRSYRQATGQSLWQYVLRCRARHASALIAAQPATTLAEIATLSGFASYNQFIAVFRKSFGLTPGAYRRLLEQRGLQ